jgi:SAM-dependent methyltransferase
MAEKFIEGLTSPKERAVLETLGNNYIRARLIEISSLMNFLLNENLLDETNLKGLIIDLGTGSGVGLLALRKFTTGYLLGIDNAFQQRDHSYAGSYEVPTPGVTELAIANFKRADIYDFLKNYPVGTATLITAFYAHTLGWHENRCPGSRVSFLPCECDKFPKILDEIGKVLKPGGQFIFTSDEFDIRPNWSVTTTTLKGKDGENRATLIIPLPTWVKRDYQDWFKELEYSMEPELIETNGKYIGLIRDRRIKIFTKGTAS